MWSLMKQTLRNADTRMNKYIIRNYQTSDSFLKIQIKKKLA